MRREQRGSAIVEVAVLGSLIFGVLVHVLVVFGVPAPGDARHERGGT